VVKYENRLVLKQLLIRGVLMYKLLVVEDEPLIRKGILTFIDFEKIGIETVFEAEDGKKALEIVKSELPHIILTDINLPFMDGLTFAKEAKIFCHQVIIIFLTGYDYFDYAVTALKIGADDYILKPVTKVEVKAILIKAVNKLKSKQLNNELKQLRPNDKALMPEDTLGDLLKQKIDAEINQPTLSLSQLADEFGYNSSYLSGMIKKKLGKTFQEYVTENRIDKAKVLLLATSLKNYEIAEKVGFEDVNYFSLRFKQIVGVSPRQYKKEVGK